MFDRRFLQHFQNYKVMNFDCYNRRWGTEENLCVFKNQIIKLSLLTGLLIGELIISKSGLMEMNAIELFHHYEIRLGKFYLILIKLIKLN